MSSFDLKYVVPYEMVNLLIESAVLNQLLAHVLTCNDYISTYLKLHAITPQSNKSNNNNNKWITNECSFITKQESRIEKNSERIIFDFKLITFKFNGCRQWKFCEHNFKKHSKTWINISWWTKEVKMKVKMYYDNESRPGSSSGSAL